MTLNFITHDELLRFGLKDRNDINWDAILKFTHVLLIGSYNFLSKSPNYNCSSRTQFDNLRSLLVKGFQKASLSLVLI